MRDGRGRRWKENPPASLTREPRAYPPDALRHRPVGDPEAPGDDSVAESELTELEGLGGDPLLGHLHQGHLEGEGSRGSSSLRSPPVVCGFWPAPKG